MTVGRLLSRRQGGNLYVVAILVLFLFFLIPFFSVQFMKMREGVYRLSCKEIRRKVEVGVADYDANNTRSIVSPKKPIDLDVLKGAGFLAQVQYCPEGGKFIFGPQGEVLCTIHRPFPEPLQTTGTASVSGTGTAPLKNEIIPQAK